MEVITLVVGGYGVNCYIGVNGEDCIVVDPGDDWTRISRVIRDRSLNLCGVLITHGHFDHIGGLAEQGFPDNIPVYAHQKESESMMDPYKNLSVTIGKHISVSATDYISHGYEFTLGQMEITAIEIYGHTANSVCYYFKEDGLIFTGDTLFAGAIGRTDLLGASIYDLTGEIKEKLFILDDDVRVLPGHGQGTTIGIEKKTNPYLSA